MKLCKDCKHFAKDRSSNPALDHKCVHPRYGINPVTGEQISRSPSVQRESINPTFHEDDGSSQTHQIYCTIDALFFEPKKP